MLLIVKRYNIIPNKRAINRNNLTSPLFILIIALIIKLPDNNKKIKSCINVI